MDNDGLLSDLDLSQYSEAERGRIAQNIYSKLEDRVGEKVAAQVPDDKFEEFELLVDQADDEKIDQWLDINVQNYDQMVSDELDKLKEAFRGNPSEFLEPVSGS